VAKAMHRPFSLSKLKLPGKKNTNFTQNPQQQQININLFNILYSFTLFVFWKALPKFGRQKCEEKKVKLLPVFANYVPYHMVRLDK